MKQATPLSLRQISRFFFPLMLNVQLMSFSHNIINMALARQADAVANLAAFAVAIALHLFLASPGYQNHTIALALVRGRRSLISVSLFVLAASLGISMMLALIAWTPFGQFVFEQLIGVSPDLAKRARDVIAILAFLPFFTGIRGLCQGIVMRAHRTELVSLATLIRIGSLVVILLLAGGHVPGPQLGALGLLGCIAVECLMMLWFACKCGIVPTGSAEHGVRDTFRYSLPLAFSSSMQQIIPLMISAIGQSPARRHHSPGSLRSHTRLYFFVGRSHAQPAAGLPGTGSRPAGLPRTNAFFPAGGRDHGADHAGGGPTLSTYRYWAGAWD